MRRYLVLDAVTSVGKKAYPLIVNQRVSKTICRADPCTISARRQPNIKGPVSAMLCGGGLGTHTLIERA
jgi:hypothetical protein